MSLQIVALAGKVNIIQKNREIVFAEVKTKPGPLYIIGASPDDMECELEYFIARGFTIESVTQVSLKYMKSLRLINFEHGLEVVTRGDCNSYACIEKII